MPERAKRNRTLTCTEGERISLAGDLVRLTSAASLSQITGRLLLGDVFETVRFLPARFVDLLILDPPYNLTRNFGGRVFRRKPQSEYSDWFKRLIDLLIPMLKPTATVYVCSDWRTSTLIFPVLNACLKVRNRITWEREKGRGAKANWKNTTEDIWVLHRIGSVLL